MYISFKEIKEKVKASKTSLVSVACAHDNTVLKAICDAYNAGVANFLLYGDENKIRKIAKEESLDISAFKIFDIIDDEEASKQAVLSVRNNESICVMKGLVSTSTIMKAVLNKEYGIRKNKLLSHVAIFDIPKLKRLIIVTDPALNIAPDINQKSVLIQNSVEVSKALGVEKPIVGVVCAVEKVNDIMPATTDAKKLENMNAKGEIEECIVVGPLGLDNALFREAAIHKGIDNPHAGRSDILLMHNIESANALYKSISTLMDVDSAGIVMGAKTPVILTSRTDTSKVKLDSIIMAIYIALREGK